ncbi:hypothetical protein PV326_009903, partial [Microctonus aethiopoides]
DSGEKTTPIDLQKLLTPAMDSTELLQAKKKMYASSCFYAPTHPTVEDQVELARRISYSLSDVKNMKSKGQSMYVNRKKRSVKWIHDGNGADGEEEPPSPVRRDKVPLKCMMNPNGKVLDIHGIQALGEEPNIGTSPINAEKLFDIVRDLNNQKGRGAEIFAKRRKRSEKWVVDKEISSTPSTPIYPKVPSYPSNMDYGSNENSKFTNLTPISPINQPIPNNSQSFYNPFTMDISVDNLNISSGIDERRSKKSYENGSRKYEPEKKKIYLREVAVGTDSNYLMHEHQLNGNRNGLSVEKSRRMSFDSDNYPISQSNGNTQRRNKHQTKSSHNRSEPFNRENGVHHRDNDHHERHYQHQQHRLQDEEQENDYTPVPVKQLIQEFEKTCRPILQYKQMNQKVIPIIQNPPIDDISRFFNSPRIPNKNPDVCSVPKHSVNGNRLNSNGNVNVLNGNGNNNVNGYSRNHVQHNSLAPQYEYDSTDDEIDDSFGESSSSDNCNGDFYDTMPSPRYSNGTRMSSMSNRMSSVSDYDYRRQLIDCVNEQLFEAPPGFRNGDMADKFIDTDADMPIEAKSLILAGITSQEDILEQIKQLRRTPILENLMNGPSSDCSNQLHESTYSGPKINSFQTLTNYNTAPRGWDQGQTFYRPVTFDKPLEPIAYSDF